MDLFDRLLGHDKWTTSHYMELAGRLKDEQLDQEFDIGLRTVRRTFDHVIVNVDFWTGLMVGKPVDYDEVREDLSLNALAARHETSYTAFEGVARKLTAEGRLDETFIDHYEVPQSFGGTIGHVILHNQGHRGEILHMFTRLGLPNVEDMPEGDPQEWEHMTGIIKR